MSDPLIDRGGVPVNADSLYARLSQESQERIDALITQWTHPDVKQFTVDAWSGHEPELAQFDEDTVKELGKNTI